jgi:cytochrome c5
MLSRIVSLAALLVAVPCVLHAQSGAAELPPGDGRELVQKVCTSCHTLTPVLMKRDGENGWRHTVGRMVLQRQAQLLPDEFEAVVRYLSTRLGPGTTQMQTGVLPPGSFGSGATAKEVRLPDGPGKELVEARCSVCHDLGRVVSIPRKTDEWEEVTRNMIGRGPQASPAQVDAIIAYLTSHFLEKAEESR